MHTCLHTNQHMKSLFALGFASLYGIIIRYFFGFFANYYEIISLSLMALAPFLVGFLTIILTDQKKVGGYLGAFFRPWLTSLVLLLVTIVLAMEGTICWIMIYPFFAVAAGVGGIAARYYALRRQRKNDTSTDDQILDDIERQDVVRLSPLLMLPLVVGAFEGDRLQHSDDYTITREIVIAAPAEKVWSTLVNVAPIEPDAPRGWVVDWLGLPRHLRTQTDTIAVGGKRTAYYDRGLYIEESISEIVPNEKLSVNIKADPGSVPPTVLDDHLVIGGKHFKGLNDTYTLTPLPDGSTRLNLSVNIRIHTPINWYAGWWARWVVDNILDILLALIEKRAVADSH